MPYLQIEICCLHLLSIRSFLTNLSINLMKICLSTTFVKTFFCLVPEPEIVIDHTQKISFWQKFSIFAINKHDETHRSTFLISSVAEGKPIFGFRSSYCRSQGCFRLLEWLGLGSWSGLGRALVGSCFGQTLVRSVSDPEKL